MVFVVRNIVRGRFLLFPLLSSFFVIEGRLLWWRILKKGKVARVKQVYTLDQDQELESFSFEFNIFGQMSLF